MNCAGCPSVPAVPANAVRGYAMLPQALAQRVLQTALAWLVERHAGLAVYAGIAGRQYTLDERKAIALETAVVARLACPWAAKAGCALPVRRFAGSGPPYGWLPTLLARELAPCDLSELVRHGAIADAKIALLNRNAGFPVREQMLAAR